LDLAEELDRLIARIETTIGWKTPEQGAATSVLLATSPRLDGIGGRYFEDCNQAPPLDVVPGDVPNACGGWAVAEGAVGALLVVVAEPVWQRCAARVT
jgi:hypothetical protein